LRAGFQFHKDRVFMPNPVFGSVNSETWIQLELRFDMTGYTA